MPPQIGQLKALTKLNLYGCPLKELPPQITTAVLNTSAATPVPHHTRAPTGARLALLARSKPQQHGIITTLHKRD